MHRLLPTLVFLSGCFSGASLSPEGFDVGDGGAAGMALHEDWVAQGSDDGCCLERIGDDVETDSASTEGTGHQRPAGAGDEKCPDCGGPVLVAGGDGVGDGDGDAEPVGDGDGDAPTVCATLADCCDTVQCRAVAGTGMPIMCQTYADMYCPPPCADAPAIECRTDGDCWDKIIECYEGELICFAGCEVE